MDCKCHARLDQPRILTAGFSDYQQLSTAEAVLDGFFAACLSRPDSCLLSQRDTSVQNLRQQVNGLIKRLENSPYTFGPLPGEYVTSQLLREVISNALYGPFEWPVLAGLLYSLLEEDDTGIAEWASQLVGGAGAVALTFPDPFYPEMVPAIRCSDVAFRANDASAVVPIVDNFLGISPTFGGYLSALQSPLMCGQWPFQAKERYTGSFEVETRKPMLIVSNIFDPVTSLDAARNASATFRGSVLLTQDAYGVSRTFKDLYDWRADMSTQIAHLSECAVEMRCRNSRSILR